MDSLLYDSQAMEKEISSGPMGDYSDADGYVRYEYQIGKRLMWIRCRGNHEHAECVQRAKSLLPDVWLAMPDALAMAETYSRTLIPEFWAVHDRGQRDGHRLDVWSVTITPCEGIASFYISRNHDFDFRSPTFEKDDYWHDYEPICLPDLPERHHIYVHRGNSGVLCASTSEHAPIH
jgi:hypothetical protein